MTALALLMKDGTLALENKMEHQAQLDIPTVDVAEAVKGLHAATVASQRPLMEACVRLGPLSAFNSATTVQAQLIFDMAHATAVITDTANGNTAVNALEVTGLNEHSCHREPLEDCIGIGCN